MKNDVVLSLHIPEPLSRPGEEFDFSQAVIPPAGSTPRPDIRCHPEETREMAFGLVRVLTAEGHAVGPWDPKLPVETMKKGLRTMMLVRAYDERMYRQQRQGKTSFYVKCTGEEAVSVAEAMVLEHDDMCFPTYRTQGVLIARGYPLHEMMNQCYSNAADPMLGRQLPVMYSSKSHGFFSVSGNLGTQFPQAVGWAMASAYKGDRRLAFTFIGEGSTAEGDFHQALTFAAVYRAPVILNVVNNQWAISSFRGISGGVDTTYAARGLGYGLPALRVDGNDFLAVWAAASWAAERARSNLGATLIEMYTYRAEGHSTSDDPGRYRPADEGKNWPLGDPIERLSRHLMALGHWSSEQQQALHTEVLEEVRAAGKKAEKVGTLGVSRPPVEEMFGDVFAEQPWHIAEQAAQLAAQTQNQSGRG